MCRMIHNEASEMNSVGLLWSCITSVVDSDTVSHRF